MHFVAEYSVISVIERKDDQLIDYGLLEGYINRVDAEREIRREADINVGENQQQAWELISKEEVMYDKVWLARIVLKYKRTDPITAITEKKEVNFWIEDVSIMGWGDKS